MAVSIFVMEGGSKKGNLVGKEKERGRRKGEGRKVEILQSAQLHVHHAFLTLWCCQGPGQWPAARGSQGVPSGSQGWSMHWRNHSPTLHTFGSTLQAPCVLLAPFSARHWPGWSRTPEAAASSPGYHNPFPSPVEARVIMWVQGYSFLCNTSSLPSWIH